MGGLIGRTKGELIVFRLLFVPTKWLDYPANEYATRYINFPPAKEFLRRESKFSPFDRRIEHEFLPFFKSSENFIIILSPVFELIIQRIRIKNSFNPIKIILEITGEQNYFDDNFKIFLAENSSSQFPSNPSQWHQVSNPFDNDSYFLRTFLRTCPTKVNAIRRNAIMQFFRLTAFTFH